ncbi:Ig-like domain-containing protein [Nocardioides sp. BP30]|uniref:Ig-like domain-containing protein n=1 Tax=Nocardioides sp. BP30 TaxID=3036374 RepID=UPI0024693AA6|nr:Ig-like domain-containing protein [Nocardioides sp. BP30]WGL53366.1 Ig-like domain-containing protein [Nocardioides sp. BP30]
MNAFARRKRAAAAIAAAGLSVAALAGGALSAPAGAAPARTATTSTDTTYLQDTLGVPANTVIETVTYDRFQWLLQQSGKFAFLIGDPNESTANGVDFKAEAQAVDASARAAGVKKVYWFDPNLSGGVTFNTGTKTNTSTGVTTTTTLTEPNLDIRKPGATTVAAASQTVYDNAWKNLIGQYLGNGIKATVAVDSKGVSTVNTESAKVTVATDATVVNDANAPLYDYSAGTPTDYFDNTFFVYDKDNTTGSPAQADKLQSSTDLDTAADNNYGAAATAVLQAIPNVATAVKAVGQFDWWKSEINAKAAAQSPVTDSATNPNQFGGAILDDSDNSDPWAVQQVTFPELVHLLGQNASTSQNFVVLFGGTWCPNTRAVIKSVNAEAQKNNVTVYNFDTVLDGGTVGGATTSAVNPLQIRNTANYGTTSNANPSYLYGSLLSTFFKNIATQNDLNNGSYVTYYPGGDTTQPLAAVRKLQVPFLIDYQHGTGVGPVSTAIKRQWIQQNIDPSTGLASFKEYMTNWAYTDEKAGDTRLGLKDADFPTSLPIPGLATFDWKHPVYPDPTSSSDASAFLTASEQKSAGAATLLATRKTTIANVLQNNVVFAREAIDKVGYFFDGLPGGVTSTQTVTAPSVKYGTAPKITVAIANEYGRVPTGKVSLTVAGTSYPAQTIVANAASFTLPKLAAGSYSYTLSYPGDDQILAFSKTGTLSVAKGSVASVKGTASKKPTSKKAGVEKVTVATAAGNATATGKVTVTLKKGSAKKTATATLKSGVATVKLPKLAKGTWTVKLAYAGDADYAASTASGTPVKVTK